MIPTIRQRRSRAEQRPTSPPREETGEDAIDGGWRCSFVCGASLSLPLSACFFLPLGLPWPPLS